MTGETQPTGMHMGTAAAAWGHGEHAENTDMSPYCSRALAEGAPRQHQRQHLTDTGRTAASERETAAKPMKQPWPPQGVRHAGGLRRLA